jgi:hypothetical protein
MINSPTDLIAAMANQSRRAPFLINKATIANQLAGGFSSFWRATGTPTQPSIPGAAAIPQASDAGSLVSFADAAGGESWYLARLSLARATAGDTIIIGDRVGHMGGLSGVTTGNQTVNLDCSVATNNLAARINQTTYEDVEWYAEIYTDIGVTGQTCTVTYTPPAGGSPTMTFTLGGASPANRAGRLFPLIPSNGDRIKSIASVSIGTTTGTAGSWGITAIKRLTSECYPVALRQDISPWDRLGLPPVANKAHLMMYAQTITTSTGTAIGEGLLVTK